MSLENVKNRLVHYFDNPNHIVFDPFKENHFFTKRMFEGYYGPLASMDRSASVENRSGQLINQIVEARSLWEKNFSRKTHEKVVTLKNKEIESLQNKWLEIPKGGIEEEAWLTESIGFTTAYFERYIKKKAGKKIKMWDNQLLYLALMDLGEGKYSFGNLSTTDRAVQLDTGEGKTKCTGLLTAINLLQGKEVIIVEQNYISAEDHAKELAPFFDDFLNVETGVVVDRSFGKGTVKEARVTPEGLIEERLIQGESLRENYYYSQGQRNEDPGLFGRQRSWRKKVVYCDHNSLGMDIAADRQLTTKKEDILVPDLNNKVGLIQEADGLVIDEAANPFQIQVPTSGDRNAWYLLSQLFYNPAETYLESKRTHRKKSLLISEPIMRKPTEKKADIEFTKDFYFSLFNGLYTIINTDDSPATEWKKKKAYITTVTNQLLYDSSVPETAIEAVTPYLEHLFRNGRNEIKKFLTNNSFIIETALEILMTGQPGRGFVPGEKPVLMDQYGVPLDNRQKDVVYQAFLHLYNVWEKEGLTKKSVVNDSDIERVKRKLQRNALEIPLKIANKIIPSVLYREFGELRLTSGTLIPISKSLHDLYETEALAVSRHKSISEMVTDRKGLQTICLDGGIAEVEFIEKQRLASKIFSQIKEIQKNGQAGLIIMPDGKSANELNQLLVGFFDEEAVNNMEWEDQIRIEGIPNQENGIRVVTGTEEFHQRGTLNESISDIKPGDIIITTQMAHRDIDPKISKQVNKNGGLTTIVYTPPNERGLWQALQRSIRADTPGRRILLISEESVKDIRNLYLIDPPPNASPLIGTDVLRREKQAEIDKLFKESIQGNLDAQTDLFHQYILGLRNTEKASAESIMFSMVRELPLKNIRENIFGLIGEKGTNTMENYISLITYAVYKKRYPHIILSPNTVNQFIDLPDNKERIQLLKNVGVYGKIDFIQVKNEVQKMIYTTFWSDLLETTDYLYRDFCTKLMGSDIQHHSYIQYQGGWKQYLENFIANDLDLRLYFLDKIGDLEI